jgi:hypothetical protein
MMTVTMTTVTLFIISGVSAQTCYNCQWTGGLDPTNCKLITSSTSTALCTNGNVCVTFVTGGDIPTAITRQCAGGTILGSCSNGVCPYYCFSGNNCNIDYSDSTLVTCYNCSYSGSGTDSTNCKKPNTNTPTTSCTANPYCEKDTVTGSSSVTRGCFSAAYTDLSGCTSGSCYASCSGDFCNGSRSHDPAVLPRLLTIILILCYIAFPYSNDAIEPM